MNSLLSKLADVPTGAETATPTKEINDLTETPTKSKKCTMFRREVVFLGRVVSAEGYKLDPSTMAPILRLKDKPPATVNEVRKLMGFLNYYRRYIENFSRIAKPIYDLVKIPETETEKHTYR